MEKNQEKRLQRPPVWDCGSSLYDSFELKSFERQLDSAIISSSSRTLSMPHLSDHRGVVLQGTTTSGAHQPSKKSSKISRSLHKLIRSFFRPKQNSSSSNSRSSTKSQNKEERSFVVYGTSGALTMIPEGQKMTTAPDYEMFSPEVNPLVRRTASDRITGRFTAANIGISCA